ncbi:MAG: hypothetical protein HOB82_06535 [Alphaproteobacteria bacterium]|jgi:hypothetical protein|nr:hypothetical protein [Alphaproteobacteria bacterium]MBT4711167.1 hypothetical protein [Alphaproteobacteria bacterium]MBT5860827.1 hypothetical protein [Alphaproteobacteria bacterium]
MSLVKRLSGLLSLARRGVDASDPEFQAEVERIAKGVAPLEIEEEMDWGEPSGKSFAAEKSQALAELQAILESMPRPAGGSNGSPQDNVRAADAARAVLASIGHADEAAPPAQSPVMDDVGRDSLINEAMGNWARGHDILSRMDPKVRDKIQVLADQMLPD